jgi:hypothetical protein
LSGSDNDLNPTARKRSEIALGVNPVMEGVQSAFKRDHFSCVHMTKPIGGDGPGAGTPGVRDLVALGILPTLDTGIILSRRVLRIANRLRHHPERPVEAASALASLLSVERENAFSRARHILEISVQRSVQPLLANDRVRLQLRTKLLVRALLFVMAMEDNSVDAL